MNKFASEVNFLRENIARTFFFAGRGKTAKTIEPVKNIVPHGMRHMYFFYQESMIIVCSASRSNELVLKAGLHLKAVFGWV